MFSTCQSRFMMRATYAPPRARRSLAPTTATASIDTSRTRKSARGAARSRWSLRWTRHRRRAPAAADGAHAILVGEQPMRVKPRRRAAGADRRPVSRGDAHQIPASRYPTTPARRVRGRPDRPQLRTRSAPAGSAQSGLPPRRAGVRGLSGRRPVDDAELTRSRRCDRVPST
jgi:hypothetical protein